MIRLLEHSIYDHPVRPITFENDSQYEISLLINDKLSIVHPNESISYLTEHPQYYLFSVFRDGRSMSKIYPIRSNSNYITLKLAIDGTYQPTYFMNTCQPIY